MVATVRRFDFDKDYDIISAWWREHGSYVPMQQHLPPTGLMVEIENEPASAGFLFNTDAKICVVEFIICNPQLNKQQRNDAINLLIEKLRDVAIKIGYTAIYTSTGIPKFINRFKDAGFIEADKNQTHMFYFDYETKDLK